MRLLVVASLALAFAVAAAGACGDDGGGDDTPTPQATTGGTPFPTPPPKKTPTVDIRDVDVSALPAVQAALEEAGGVYHQEDVIYADVTNDAIEDAVVPVAVDGSLGNIGFIVLTVDGDTARVLMKDFPSELPGLQVALEGEKIVVVQPAPGPDDPECCPSFLRKTVYAWNGAALAVESVTTEPNPDGGAKRTPSATP
jgi:hypothetical protein